MKSLKLRAAFLLLLLVGSIVLALGFGSVTLPTDTLFAEVSAAFAGETSKNAMILFDIRLPRILFAVLAGAALGLTGLLMQTVSQNYLADPYILGVSAGASTGAVVCIVSGLAQQLFGYGIYIGAFFGAALSTALVIFLTGRSGSPVRLVLMGMGISALFSALTMLAIYGAKDEAQVRSAMFWLMGSLTGIQWKAVPVMAAALAALMLFIWLLRHELDILLLGKEEARHLGMCPSCVCSVSSCSSRLPSWRSSWRFPASSASSDSSFHMRRGFSASRSTACSCGLRRFSAASYSSGRMCSRGALFARRSFPSAS